MSQTLIIASDPEWGGVMEVNLNTYVGTDVVRFTSFSKARGLIESHPKISLIVCETNCGDENTAQNLEQFMFTLKKKVPVIFLGQYSSELESFKILSSQPAVKDLLQAAAQYLEVSAQKMLMSYTPDYFPIEIQNIVALETTPCDVYIRLAEDKKYVKLFHVGSAITSEQIQKYIEKGIIHLYVEAPHRLKFINSMTQTILGKLNNKNLSEEETIKNSDRAYQAIQEEVKANPENLSEEAAQLATAVIKNINKITADVPQMEKLITKLLSNQASYIYQHFVLISYLSRLVIEQIDWGSKEHSEKLEMVAFFHDIALPDDNMAKIHDEKELNNSQFSVDEKDRIYKHAKIAADLMQRFPKMPIGVDTIILQHHGTINGQGFAKTYTNSISPLGIVFIVIEEFVKLVLSLDNPKDISKYKNQFIGNIKEKYPRSKYIKIVECLEQINF